MSNLYTKAAAFEFIVNRQTNRCDGRLCFIICSEVQLNYDRKNVGVETSFQDVGVSVWKN